MKKITGKFTEDILCEKLLPNEPAGIVRILTHTLNSSSAKVFNTDCTVHLYISDAIEQYCNYVYSANYVEKIDYQSDLSSVHFIDLKAPLGNSIYFVILHITKDVHKSTGHAILQICMCYIHKPNTNIRLLQYTHNRLLLEASRIY